jgi:orotate phosphoribosyltransferase
MPQHRPQSGALAAEVLAAAGVTRGHFRYESGHHGDVWLDLEPLLADAGRLKRWAAALAAQAAACRPEIVCGPLTGGAFVAQMLAAEIGAGFIFTERSVNDGRVSYRLPAGLRAAAAGRRVLLADDAVNAGSALLATLAEIRGAGGELAAFAALIALGEAAGHISRQHGTPFFTLATLERAMWPASECPLCRSGVAFSDTGS